MLALLSSTCLFPQQHTFSLMLDPSGDIKNTGRKIDDCFERGLTLQCAEKLKIILEERYPTIRVVLTRFAGETVAPFQNAHFANRLDVDLYISIHFYHEAATQPQSSLYIYTFAYGNEGALSSSDTAFYSIDKAHWQRYSTTRSWAHSLFTHFQETTENKLFYCKGIHSLPFKPLMGIKAPAIGLELGLKDTSSWHDYVDIIAQGIGTLITKTQPLEVL